MNPLKDILTKIIAQQNLSYAEMTETMRQMMTGQVPESVIGGFLVAMQMKEETSDEIAAAATLIRELATPIAYNHTNLVDIVGTGGDNSKLFNISTASVFVLAAAGAKVAKHNNRSVSSQSGSADVLEIAEINPILTPEQVIECLDKIGIAFIFAPHYHRSFSHTINTRRQLGIKTLFNILGPLCNPVPVKQQLIGIYDNNKRQLIAEVLQQLGSRHALVVHSDDGLDEISIATATQVTELKNDKISSYTIHPSDFGLNCNSLDSLRVNNAKESYQIIQQVLEGSNKTAMHIVALNAGAALYSSGLATDISHGVQLALTQIESGAAKNKLDSFIKQSQIYK